jgi:AAA domain
VSGFLWRLVFGALAVRALRLVVRWAPTVAVWAAGLALWPSIAVAWGLRRRALPAVRARWPRAGRWGEAALALATLALAIALVLAGAERRAALAALYLAGWVGPLTLPLGVAPGLVALAVVAAAPLWLAGGVALAALWPPGAALVRRAVRRPPAGADGGRPSGHRTPAAASAPVAVTLKPVPTQRIAAATFREDAWTVKPLYGPGLLAMIVAPPGVGKTEIAYGSLAAAVDGLAFCGLPTTKPRRVLLLSEMEPKTIQPALWRWGFVAEASGPLHRLRLRWLRPEGSPGHLIDVVHASDAYAPDGEGRRPQWADVIRATVPVVERGGYDLLIVDSLARWMGNDSSNAAMLDALGALRQVTRRGVGVLAPHHCAKDAQAPYEPRGGSAILGELDLCWSLARLPGGGDPLHDPRRVLECVKSRFAELTPPSLRLERVDVDPDAHRPRYGYRLLDGTGAGGRLPAGETRPRGVDALPEQPRRVLEALVGAPGHRATNAELRAPTGLERNRVHDALLLLIKGGWARVGGAGERPPRGGLPSTVYTAPAQALAQLAGAAAQARGDADGQAARLLREALDPQPSEEAA